ncbi:hypothetical protein [Catellatospora tritici]|uniref:hypothetical protein n=1 Tax=Catellatospora tritici TaxID=2851566 RepID=UPI001C2DBED3|nr:hypothetical protein [Catellatospora tritici]MBV1855439.1 hypothetical protein [Catellatospora tritici]
MSHIAELPGLLDYYQQLDVPMSVSMFLGMGLVLLGLALLVAAIVMGWGERRREPSND